MDGNAMQHVAQIDRYDEAVYANTAVEIDVLDYNIAVHYHTSTYGDIRSVNGA